MKTVAISDAMENDIRLSCFKHPVDSIEPEPERAAAELLGDALARTLVWLVEHKGCRRSRVITTGQRALVFVWCVRPDLVANKSGDKLAAEIGMSPAHFYRAAENFREIIATL